MRIFSLTREFTLSTNRFQRSYLPVTDPLAAQVDRLYLEIGSEFQILREQIVEDHVAAHPGMDEAAGNALPLSQLGIICVDDAALAAWPSFPMRLGRVSSCCIVAQTARQELHFHQEPAPLLAQLQILRAKKPGKRHFRFAVVNGFGQNLGDCTTGITAFRQVLRHLKASFPEISCDILFGPGASIATADLVAYEPEVDRALYLAPTVADFAQYDGYFDFTGLVAMPRYHDMPMVDWVLWWCGLDPQAVPPAAKRNRGYVRWDAWNDVRALLKDCPGEKVLFNPKASVALRSMPVPVARRFILSLLHLDPDMTVVLDQALPDLRHERVIDLSMYIDTPEKLKALIGQVDGVVTVDTFAMHWADVCSVPAVSLLSTMGPSHFPYYPFNHNLIDGFESLPAYQKTKVPDEQWQHIEHDYRTAWEKVSPAEVLARLREKMAVRQVAGGEPRGLVLISARERATCVDTSLPVPRIKRLRVAVEHLTFAARIAEFAQQFLQPGGVCVLGCAPVPQLALSLAERLVPFGELIVFEPRASLASAVQSALFGAGALASQVLHAIAAENQKEQRLHTLDPWSESSSLEWGNSQRMIDVPCQTIDALDLLHCAALIVQSPMPFVAFLNGALMTLRRCRPLLFMAPLDPEELAAVNAIATGAGYVLWSEPVLSEKHLSPMLLVGVPAERLVQINGFSKVEST